MESTRPARADELPPVEIRLLGALSVRRHGVPQALPASRKVRALLAYLALAPQAVARGQLCELLWDVPSDPRGELRWCLSKLRGLLDEPERRRVVAAADTIRLDLTGCFVDAIEIVEAARSVPTVAIERLPAVTALFAGDFVDGLEIDRSPAFDGWLAAQRRRFRTWHVALLDRLASGSSDDAAQGHLDRWLELAPFDRRAHELLLRLLARQARIREGEEHIRAFSQLFEAEGIDWASLREAWHSARADTARHAVASAAAATEENAALASRRASIAVMPFVDGSALAAERGGPADALAFDVITRLAKLRCLFVIAQGSVFALQERGVKPQQAGRMLSVDYVVGGTVRRHDQRLTVQVELVETRTARILWAEVFDQPLDDAFLVLDAIGNRIVASIASEIETSERNRAVLKAPSSLDAWEAHHRGLWHMYRFNRTDNEQARHFFELAIRLDPTFARAHAGLSFTHFQNAFQGWTARQPEIDRAFAAAGQSLMVDDRDPAAHWAMGRVLWLRGQHDQSVTELEQAVDLSPNFALGHYTLAFVHSQGGDPDAAIVASDQARRLSPFDPMLFAMLGARAMALVRLGRFDEAADWGMKAAARPNAHAHILAIAAFTLALAGRQAEASTHLMAIQRSLPGYRIGNFLTAMQLAPEGEHLFREAARRLGVA